MGLGVLLWALVLIPAAFDVGGPLFVIVLWSLPAVIGVTLPYAAFGVGARLSDRRGPRLLVPLVMLAAVVLVLVGWVEPTISYQRSVARGVDVEATQPFGPGTVGNRLAQRRYVLEHPPERYSMELDDPYGRPPNWIEYLLTTKGTLPLFAIMNGLLGAFCARLLLTGGRRREEGMASFERRRLLYLTLVGVVVGLLHFALSDSRARAVRLSTDSPGVLNGIVPMAVASCILAVVWWHLRQVEVEEVRGWLAKWDAFEALRVDEHAWLTGDPVPTLIVDGAKAELRVPLTRKRLERIVRTWGVENLLVTDPLQPSAASPDPSPPLPLHRWRRPAQTRSGQST